MPRTVVLNRILAQAAQELGPIFEKAQHSRKSFTLGKMEANVVVAMRNIGGFILSELCGLGQEQHKKRVLGHPDVGEGKPWLTFVGLRPRSVLTLFGKIRFKRAYYHNADSNDSRWPREEELGLAPDQIWSPGFQDCAHYAATVTGSYQAGEKTLIKFLGVEVNYRQIQRDCLEVGAEIAETQNQQAEAALEVKERPVESGPKAGPDCVAVFTDGTIVDAHSHRGGSGLEVKVGRVDVACLQESTPIPPVQPKKEKASTAAPDKRQEQLAELKDSREQKQYQATTKLVKQALAEAAPDRYERALYRPSNPTSHYCATAKKGTEIIGGLLWALASSVGVDRAALVLFLADGSHWCWNLCKTHFPQAIQILDVFHLAKHLLEAAGAFFGENGDAARTWAREKLVEILKGHLEEVRKTLEGLSFLDKRKRDALHKLQTYLTNNSERMDYARYIAAGYIISSAAIEGMCGHVIGDRMTGSGRGWDELGADAMARLRCLYCSDQWDTFYRERQDRIVRRLRAA